ncbi:hypothetical protein KKF91_01570 [Myxococcota bacterium]|nr:hypothetical protein [Myxococcota bacterium]MBU1429226.1 hypothetical protein [Myxococcota bacterium]MBU1900218.1 hypothetical protein [Myxococcota bacterium]
MNRRLERNYEGAEVLNTILKRAGCELSDEDVRAEFLCALEEGTQAAEIIPLLWEQEPRFKSAEEARRCFANLFGLWDELSAVINADLIQLPEQDPDAPLREEIVDQAWRRLDELSDQDYRRARDRFDNVQSDLDGFLMRALTGISDAGLELALDLAFEMWFITEAARGAAPSLSLSDLLTAHAALDDPEPEPEPALAGLVTATLWEQAAEATQPLAEEEIPVIERALRAVRRRLAAKR